MKVPREDLEDLVARYVELQERGEAVSAEEFARAHPSRETELLRALSALSNAEELIPRRSDALPDRVGDYRVIDELGRGGMGRVLRVVHATEGGPERALKVFDPPTAGAERALERFRREGELLARLSHPGIVRVLGHGVAGSRPFLVLELVEGRSLAQVLALARERPARAGQPPWERLDLPGEGPMLDRICRTVAAVGRALGEMHRAGLVHRDLKPSNVIVTTAGRAVLVDFGLVHESSAETLTRTGDLLGTPQYMPPEQARGERLDERADVWGLGCLLYELVTLEPPRTGQDPVRVLEAVRTRPIRPIRSLAPDTPHELARVAERALAHHRRHRTASADLVAADLESLAAGRRVMAGGPTLAERAWRLWTFRRGVLVACAGVIALCAAVWPIQRWRAGREATERRSLYSRALSAWISEREGDAVAAIAELAPRPTEDPWSEVLRGEIEKRVPAIDASASAAGLTVRALALEAAGQSREALELHREAAGRAPEAVLPVVLLARCAALVGESSLAAGEYAAATRLLPDCAALHARLAEIHYEAKRLDEVVPPIRRALEIEPDSARWWHVLAKTHLRRQEYPSALDAARRCMDLAGESATRSMRTTWAAALGANEQFDEAQSVWRALVDEDPTDAPAAFNLAFSYDKAHRVDDARKTYEQLLLRGPNSKAEGSLAWLYSGASRSTCAECNRAYEGDPTLVDLDRAEELAVRSLSHGVAVDPGAPLVAANIAVLIGRRDRIRAAVRDLQASEQRDDRIAACARALRILDR